MGPARRSACSSYLTARLGLWVTTERTGHDPFALPFLQRWYYYSLDLGRRA